MGSIRKLTHNNNLFFDFRYQGIRCREYTLLPDSVANRKNMEKVLARIESEIKLGTFEYARFFPNSLLAQKFQNRASDAPTIIGTGLMEASPVRMVPATPFFRDFCEEWFLENEIGWKRSYRATLKLTFNKYLKPVFGEKEVSHITKREILKFRSSLAKVRIPAKPTTAITI